MLRYEKSTSRPTFERPFIPKTDLTYFSNKFWFERDNHGTSWRFAHPISDDGCYPKWNADVHFNKFVNFENVSDEQLKIYHNIRRKSCRLPENDLLIGYKLNWRDFTATQLKVLDKLSGICWPHKHVYSFLGLFGTNFPTGHFQKSNPGVDVPWKNNLLDFNSPFVNFRSYTKIYFPRRAWGTFFGDEYLCESIRIWAGRAKAEKMRQLGWVYYDRLKRFFRFIEVQERPVHLTIHEDTNFWKTSYPGPYYHRYIYSFFPKYYSRYISTKNPKTGQFFDPRDEDHTWPKYAMLSSVCLTSTLAWLGAMYTSVWRSNKSWQKLDKNEVYLSQRQRKRDHYDFVSRKALNYSNKSAFKTAIITGICSLYCCVKYLENNEITSPPTVTWTGRPQRAQNWMTRFPEFIEKKINFKSEQDFLQKNNDLFKYDLKNEIFCKSKNGYTELFAPLFLLAFLKNFRQFGPVKSFIKASLTALIYGAVPSILNFHGYLPWQIYRKVVAETRYLEWTKMRDTFENQEKMDLIFSRIVEEAHTNRTRSHSQETEVFNTLVPFLVRDQTFKFWRSNILAEHFQESKLHIPWYSCYDYEDYLADNANNSENEATQASEEVSSHTQI